MVWYGTIPLWYGAQTIIIDDDLLIIIDWNRSHL